MTVNGFRDLRVWQAGMEMVENIYLLTQQFPIEEVYGLSSQMRRAAVSVPSNIAEGHSREHLKEYLQHISIAQASLAELQTQVEIAGRLRYLKDTKVSQTIKQIESLSKQLYALRNALQKKA
ncbi:MAG: four helix bundle protein [Armatimonadota bacterium]|nr:four helix bundle protein [Armatimonadota bacterium]